MRTHKSIKILGLFVAFLPLAAGASMAVRLSLDALTDRADRVVIATVAAPGLSAWDTAQRRIYTTTPFSVEEDVAGSGPSEFSVVLPGGTVGRWAQKTHGVPAFRQGDRVLLFLHQTPQGLQVVGLCQGVFSLQRVGREELIVQQLEGLDFSRDAGNPLEIRKDAAFRRIQSRFQERRAP
jgi:hypothetical protein